MALGYGVDTWCGTSRITGRLSRGRQTLALALFRRLTTPRGTLRGSPEADVYGFDVSAFVGAVGYPRAIGALPSMVAAELRKDDRVADVLATADINTAPNGDITITLTCYVTSVDESEDFSLTVAITEVEALLVSSPPEAA